MESSLEPEDGCDASQVERQRLCQMLHLRSSRGDTPMKQQDYVRAVLDSFVSLPNAPLRPRRDDRFLAEKLYRQSIPLPVLEYALLLGCVRRELQEHGEPLQPIRSLRYFVPILEEVRHQPVHSDYVRYLRGKLFERLRPKPTTNPRPPVGRNRQLLLPW